MPDSTDTTDPTVLPEQGAPEQEPSTTETSTSEAGTIDPAASPTTSGDSPSPAATDPAAQANQPEVTTATPSEDDSTPSTEPSSTSTDSSPETTSQDPTSSDAEPTETAEADAIDPTPAQTDPAASAAPGETSGGDAAAAWGDTDTGIDTSEQPASGIDTNTGIDTGINTNTNTTGEGEAPAAKTPDHAQDSTEQGTEPNTDGGDAPKGVPAEEAAVPPMFDGEPGEGPTHSGTDTPGTLISKPCDPQTGKPLDGSMQAAGVIVGGSGALNKATVPAEASSEAPSETGSEDDDSSAGYASDEGDDAQDAVATRLDALGDTLSEMRFELHRAMREIRQLLE